MREIVREVATLMRTRIDDKGQRLDIDMPDELPAALADPSRIRQVLTNLVTNAHLYTGKGGTLSIAARAEGRCVALEVADNGRGMSEEEAHHAFDRFYRAAQGDGPGTGLGLSIVQSLVELHDGRVDLQTELGRGSRFTVLIPQAPPLAEDGRGAPRAALHGKRVLVIDDEPAIAQLIATRLEPFDVTTAVAHSGEEALRRLRAEPFDAITLDILMPGMSGFEVLRQLRADPELRGLPVVVVSVFSGHEALAGEWVVAKPIDADELVDALGAALLAGRVRVLVVGRGESREQLEPRLDELGIEHEWATSSGAAARLCQRAPLRGGARRRRAVASRERARRAGPARAPAAAQRGRLLVGQRRPARGFRAAGCRAGGARGRRGNGPTAASGRVGCGAVEADLVARLEEKERQLERYAADLRETFKAPPPPPPLLCLYWLQVSYASFFSFLGLAALFLTR